MCRQYYITHMSGYAVSHSVTDCDRSEPYWQRSSKFFAQEGEAGTKSVWCRACWDRGIR